MNILTWLTIGEEALPLAEKVFSDAEPLVEKLIGDGKELGVVALNLFNEAKSEFETVKTSGIAGTDVGKVASDFTADLTTAWANAKQLVGNDPEKIAQLISAGMAQLKLLTAQLAAGNDVTAQPKS